MATSDFLIAGNPIYKFSQYTQTTVALFSTQFNTDWSATLGQTVQLLATTAMPTQAIFIAPSSGAVLRINGGQARTTTTDGVTTNLSTTVTAVDGNFTQSDVGGTITGTGIPGSTTIVSVASATTAVLSNAATASASNIAFTITPTGGDWVGYNPGVGWQAIPAHSMSTFYTATSN